MWQVFKRKDILFVPFIVTAVTIVSLFIISQIITLNSIRLLKTSTDVINLAGKERMFAQQIIKIVAADDLGGQTINLNMDSIIREFFKDHAALISYFLPQNEKRKKFLFSYAGLKQLDNTFRDFYTSVISTPDTVNVNENFIGLINRQETYLVQVEHLITAIDNFSKHKTNNFRKTEEIIFGALIVIILFEIIFVFFPIIRKVQKQNEQLKAVAFNQSHIIRQPVANIKGLLCLLTDIKPDEDEAKKLIVMANSEVERLDSIIEDNVTATQ